MASAAPLFLGAGGLRAIGALHSARSEADAAEFNRDIEIQNSVLAKRQTELDIVQLRRSAHKQIGGIRASIGASGITLSGSALDVLEDSTREAELDIHRRRFQWDLEVRGRAQNVRRLNRRAADARTAGFINAAGAILGGSAQASNANAGVPVRIE